MIKVLLEGHDFQYEVGELLKVFVEGEKIEFIADKALVDNQSFLFVSSIWNEFDKIVAIAQIIKEEKVIYEKRLDCKIEEFDNLKMRKVIKRTVKLCMFDVLSKFYNINPPWGILTGIRPTKIVYDLMDEGYNIQEIQKYLKENYRMSKDKIDLVIKIVQVEKPFITMNKNNNVGVYISIPFCPTRCVYCSFPSNPLNKGKNHIKEYLKALIYEVQETGKILKDQNKKVETLYIGGGTPTTLSALELEMLMNEVKNNIDLSYVKEITVEAGRPDTISIDKLMILKKNGVNRISINPQTMNQETLEVIGRSHTTQDIVNAYNLAKQIGFDTINMDIIIGLPGETLNMVENTMKQIEKLHPENLTVHTLAVKRTSPLKESISNYSFVDEEKAKKMLEMTAFYAKKMGLIPYYMYRQKYMLGNLENIGYAKHGHECIYNIQIIEEKQSIIALGAGAISKIYYPKENRLERVPNVTNVEQYITRIEEMINRKRKELEKLNEIHIDI